MKSFKMLHVKRGIKIVFFLFACSDFIYAQMSYQETGKSPDLEPFKIVAALPDSSFILHSTKKQSEEFYKTDAKLKRIKTLKIKKEDWKNDSLIFLTNYCFDNRVLLFFKRSRMGKRSLQVQELETDSFVLNRSYETIYQCGSNDPELSGFFVKSADNGKFLLVSFEQYGIRKFFMLDENFQLRWNISDAANTKGKVEDIKITNDGRVIFLSPHLNGTNQSFALCEIKDGSVTKTILNNSYYELSSASIGFTNSGRAFVTGYYSFVIGEGVEIRNTGMFFYAPWVEGGELKWYSFNDDLKSVKKGSIFNPSNPKILLGPSGQNFYHIAGEQKLETYVTSSGNVFLLAEALHYSESLWSDMTVSLRGNFFVFWFVFGSGKVNLDYGNLIISRLDTLGKLYGHSEILKLQSNDWHASYKAFMRQDSLCIFYNSGMNSCLGPSVKKSAVHSYFEYAPTVPMLLTMNGDGGTGRNFPLRKSSGNANIVGSKVQRNRLYFYMQRRGAYYIGNMLCE